MLCLNISVSLTTSLAVNTPFYVFEVSLMMATGIRQNMQLVLFQNNNSV